MRMYLSSFRLGNDPQALVRLAVVGARCALVLNALDNADEARARFHDSQSAALSELGFPTTELDLREYFADAAGLAGRLATVDMLWITGGNAFLLRKAMRQSGFDVLLPALLATDAIVYAGFSAAAVITYRHLHALTPSPASYDPPVGYDPGLVWDGLGITDDAIVVHYASDHPGRPQADDEAAYCRRHAIPCQLLWDGEALVISGAERSIAGLPMGE